MNRRLIHITLLLLGLSVSFPAPADDRPREPWKALGKGIEYGIFSMRGLPEGGNGSIHIVRIDPAQARLKLVLASEHGKSNRSAARWCNDFNMVAAINAGMFYKDYLTNTGYLRNKSHIQNRRWNRKYKSALAFAPRRNGVPRAIMVDLDSPDSMKRLEDYDAVIQNLRLVKGNGVSVWSREEKKWSESAVGMDREGRVLFLFCRSPLTMRDFNEGVKSLGLGVVRMMHTEGGPLASLSIRTGGLAVNLAGSYETGFRPDNTNMHQWPIPNAIGVQSN